MGQACSTWHLGRIYILQAVSPPDLGLFQLREVSYIIDIDLQGKKLGLL